MGRHKTYISETSEEKRKRLRGYYQKRYHSMTVEERRVYNRSILESSTKYKEAHARRLDRAIKLLEENGYKVTI